MEKYFDYFKATWGKDGIDGGWIVSPLTGKEMRFWNK
jgi:hypothetical protein